MLEWSGDLDGDEWLDVGYIPWATIPTIGE
jgi:hypothetical protein